MALGVLVGAICHEYADRLGGTEVVAGYLRIPSDIFLRLIKMIIAPLVFATLVLGIAQMGDGATVGRIGARTLAWFLGASLLSLTLGLTMVTLFKPGLGLALPTPVSNPGVQLAAPSLNKFIVELAPASIAKAMSDNAVLQIVVFSVFMGVAISAVGARAAPLVRGISALADVMLQITNYVMAFAPVAVFAAIAAVITAQGLSILVTYSAFVGEFYLSLIILWVLLLLAGSVVLGSRAPELVRYIREPVLIAFSTASSEASYPKTLAQLERFGVPNRIASFVLPLGYSFNLDGSMMYMTFATLFIAQAYGIHFSAGQLATLMLLLMVTSKGMAAVPRASLVVVAATLPFFNIPEAGLLLVLGIDQFLDMGRTATNVVGNAVATAVVAKWEGELEAPAAPDHVISPARPENIA